LGKSCEPTYPDKIFLRENLVRVCRSTYFVTFVCCFWFY
jgi:hypothetical protein